MCKNKEWLIKAIEDEKSLCRYTDEERHYDISLGLAEQLEEVELPSIPSYIADELEELKRNFNLYSVFGSIKARNITIVSNTLLNWFFKSDKDNEDVFAKAWTVGYTVSEPLYRLQWTMNTQLYLVQDLESGLFGLTSDLTASTGKTRFTEKEIEDFPVVEFRIVPAQ